MRPTVRRGGGPEPTARSPRRAARAGRSLLRLPDRAPEADLAVVDPDVEAALRVAADPRLVGDRRAVAPIIRERQERSFATFPAVGELRGLDVHRVSSAVRGGACA